MTTKTQNKNLSLEMQNTCYDLSLYVSALRNSHEYSKPIIKESYHNTLYIKKDYDIIKQKENNISNYWNTFFTSIDFIIKNENNTKDYDTIKGLKDNLNIKNNLIKKLYKKIDKQEEKQKETSRRLEQYIRHNAKLIREKYF